MAVKFNSSGGGSVLLDAPSTASNLTVTLPSASGTLLCTGAPFSGGTANGVVYLNGSSVPTTGSALTFDGTKLVATASTGGSVTYPAYFNNDGGGSGTGARIGFRNGASSYGDFGYLYDGLFSQIIDSAGSSNTRFLIGGTEQMRLTSTGLGIGTSSPAYKLDVLSSSYVAGRFLRNISGTGGGGIQVGNLSRQFSIYGGNAALYFYDEVAALDRLILDSSGNLGLGVTPSAWNSGAKAFDVNNSGSLFSFGSSSVGLAANAYFNGTNWIYRNSNNANLYSVSGGVHAWYNAPSGTAGNPITLTQALTLNANGVLALQGGNTSATGTGIAFPATQSASSDANTLDDYEEGTWTPTYTSDGTNPTVSYGGQTGRYVKIGRVVQFWIYLYVNTTSGGTGQLQISGLPFASNEAPGGATNDWSYAGWTTQAPNIGHIGSSGSTVILLSYFTPTGTARNVTGNLKNGCELTMYGSYITST